MVLLHAATRLGLGERLRAVHVHHALSPHADVWAAHCQRLCTQLGVALSVQCVQVPRDGGEGIEAAARQVRYAAFAACDADVLLLAHHQGDLAETVLFNLLRGSGVAGASGMPVERPLGRVRLLRPWLDLAPQAVAAYADAEGLAWIEDESNEDRAFSRNFLRHEILPPLLARFPAGVSSLAVAARHFTEAAGLLAELAQIDWECCRDGDCLRLSGVRGLSPERLKNLLRWRLQYLGWRKPVTARLEEFARQLLTAGPDRHPALVLPEGEMAVRRGRVHWIPA